METIENAISHRELERQFGCSSDVLDRVFEVLDIRPAVIRTQGKGKQRLYSPKVIDGPKISAEVEKLKTINGNGVKTVGQDVATHADMLRLEEKVDKLLFMWESKGTTQ